jgi:chromosome segregation ATPase
MTEKKEYYCGLKPRYKGQRGGTMKECLASKQVRRFGVNKIDPKLLESEEKKKKEKKEGVKTLSDLRSQRGSILGRFNRLKKDLSKLDEDDSKVTDIKKEMNSLSKEYSEVHKRITEFSAKKEDDKEEIKKEVKLKKVKEISKMSLKELKTNRGRLMGLFSKLKKELDEDTNGKVDVANIKKQMDEYKKEFEEVQKRIKELE